MTERKYKRGDPDPTPDSWELKCPHRTENPYVKPCDDPTHEHPTTYLECTWDDCAHDPEQHVAGGSKGRILHAWDV